MTTGYGFNKQNSSGDTVCWRCRGDAFACECPTERHPMETVEAFRTRIRPFLNELLIEWDDRL